MTDESLLDKILGWFCLTVCAIGAALKWGSTVEQQEQWFHDASRIFTNPEWTATTNEHIIIATYVGGIYILCHVCGGIGRAIANSGRSR